MNTLKSETDQKPHTRQLDVGPYDEGHRAGIRLQMMLRNNNTHSDGACQHFLGAVKLAEGNHVIPLKSTSNKKEEIDTSSILCGRGRRRTSSLMETPTEGLDFTCGKWPHADPAAKGFLECRV